LISGAKEAFMDTRLTPLEKTEKKINIAAEVARLAKMTVSELRTRHAELFGEPAKSHHKKFRPGRSPGGCRRSRKVGCRKRHGSWLWRWRGTRR
jgi:hypothetical protein